MANIQDVTYVIEFLDTRTGTISVLYKTPVVSMGLRYNVDLPIENNMAPTVAALHELIMHSAPVAQLTDAETQEAWIAERKAMLQGVDLSEIAALVRPPQTEPQPISQGAQTL